MKNPFLLILILAVAGLAYFLYNNQVPFFSKADQTSTQNSFEQITKRVSELKQNEKLKTAVVAGGCFWCMEGPFEQMDGVEEAVAGYIGGDLQNPTYEQVSTGATGHREGVMIYYDPALVSYEQLLEKFWAQIDPTDPGGQFADRGSQYKTAIFYSDDGEKQIAESSKQALGDSGRYKEPIVTDILPMSTFYPAEDYHQDYYIHSSERYNRYKKGSGREDFVKNNQP